MNNLAMCLNCPRISKIKDRLPAVEPEKQKGPIISDEPSCPSFESVGIVQFARAPQDGRRTVCDYTN